MLLKKQNAKIIPLKNNKYSFQDCIKEEEEEPLYIMTIELDEGETDQIKVYPNSNSEELSYDFCHKNNLSFKTLKYLKTHIDELMNKNQIKNNKIKDKKSIIPQRSEATQNTQKAKTPKKTTNILNTLYKSFISKTKNYTKLNKEHKNKSSLIRKVKEEDISYNKKGNQNLSLSENYIYFNERMNSKSKEKIKSSKLLNIKKSIDIEKKKIKNDKQIHNKLRLKSNNLPNYKSKNSSLNKISINSELTNKNNKTQSNKNFTHYKNRSFSPISQYESKSLMKNQINSPNEKYNKRSFIQNCSSPTIPRPIELKNITKAEYSSKISLSFSSRQILYKQKTEKNIEKLRQELHSPIDAKTGQCLFHPKVNQIKKSPNNSISTYSNIFAKLYKYAEKYKNNQLNRNEREKSELDQLTKPKISKNTDSIFKKKKSEIFRNYFKLLDADDDGMISIYTIDTKKFNQEILSIIEPIIHDLREYQGTINEDEFISECEKLFDKLPYQSRKKMLSRINN